MNLNTLQSFLGWSTLIHMGLLIWAGVMLMACGNRIHRMHSRWFPMPRDTFNVVTYSFLGLYKLLIFVFALVPWLVLLILNR